MHPRSMLHRVGNQAHFMEFNIGEFAALSVAAILAGAVAKAEAIGLADFSAAAAPPSGLSMEAITRRPLASSDMRSTQPMRISGRCCQNSGIGPCRSVKVRVKAPLRMTSRPASRLPNSAAYPANFT